MKMKIKIKKKNYLNTEPIVLVALMDLWTVFMNSQIRMISNNMNDAFHPNIPYSTSYLILSAKSTGVRWHVNLEIDQINIIDERRHKRRRVPISANECGGIL